MFHTAKFSKIGKAAVHWEMGVDPAVYPSSLCGWWQVESLSCFDIRVCPGASMGDKVLVI